MASSDSLPRPSSLLAELTSLHEALTELDPNDSAIPLLQDIVEPAVSTRHGVQHLRPQLMQSAEQLLQDVLHDLAPLITAELEKRLQQHLAQLIDEQEQQQHSSPPDNHDQP